MHTVFRSREALPLPKNYDTSTKQWEVKSVHYVFDLEKRCPLYSWQPFWEHHKYYSTEEAAFQAAKDLRRHYYANYDMPEFIPDNPSQGRMPPRRTLNRYKIAERSSP